MKEKCIKCVNNEQPTTSSGHGEVIFNEKKLEVLGKFSDDDSSEDGFNHGVVKLLVKSYDNRITSTKAKYIAVAEASMEAVWMRKFIDGLGDVVSSNKRPMEMLCDNEPAIAIANNARILKGAKHFQRKCHYLREVIQERDIVL
ncbi:hypothetical protein Tco_0369109 [Tanacetum coccineum]